MEKGKNKINIITYVLFLMIIFLINDKKDRNHRKLFIYSQESQIIYAHVSHQHFFSLFSLSLSLSNAVKYSNHLLIYLIAKYKVCLITTFIQQISSLYIHFFLLSYCWVNINNLHQSIYYIDQYNVYQPIIYSMKYNEHQSK